MARQSMHRRARRPLGVAVALTFGAVGCNAILGIDAGHLVPASTDAGSTGTGGRVTVDSGSGSGGASPQDSGADVGAKGGSGGGSGGSGGKGGKGGSGGTGGGAGGATDAGPPDGGGDAQGPLVGPFGVAGEVQCDTASCTLPGQACCVVTKTGDSHCSASCDSSTQQRFACDGSEDCTSGQHCCYPFGATVASCAATCAGGGKIFCGSARDCLPGQACELGGGALAKVYICTDVPTAKTVWCGGAPCDVSAGKSCCYNKTTKTETCATSCTTGNVKFTCDAADDCGASATCCESHTGLGVATGTSCTAATTCAAGFAAVTCGGSADCGAGFQCCLTGSGSTCLPTCTGAIVCDTDADCPVGQKCSVETSTALGAPTGRMRCVAP